jgi:membrane associated rhomboid family serine protease
MPAAPDQNDYSPLTWYKRTPIYVTTVLVALFVAGMFVTVFLKTARFNVEDVFAFSPAALWRRGAAWQLVTYPLLAMPSFFFLFAMFCFYWFGTDVERYLGRSRFYKLLALLLLAPPALLSLWWMAGAETMSAGSSNLTIGFFVAFATLYPNLEYWGWITMKWLAFAGIVLSSMNYLPNHDWPGLSVLLATCGLAFGYVRFLQLGGSVELPDAITRIFKRKPKFKVVRAAPDDDPHATIDPLLDKISKRGLASLTQRERDQLQRAREALMKKGG